MNTLNHHLTILIVSALESGDWTEAKSHLENCLKNMILGPNYIKFEKTLNALDLYLSSTSIGHKRALGKHRNILSALLAEDEKNDTPLPPKARVKKSTPVYKDHSDYSLETGGCLCGCGSPVDRKFKPGHDQRTKGILKRHLMEFGEVVQDKLPPVLAPHAQILINRWGITIESKSKETAHVSMLDIN